METMINLIHQWGVDRQIIGNGKLETQWLKLISEFGEMADSLAEGRSPIDDIGDQVVVMVMMVVVVSVYGGSGGSVVEGAVGGPESCKLCARHASA